MTITGPSTPAAAGVPPDQIYGAIFYILAGLLVIGFIANLLVRPVNPKWHMSDKDVAAERAKLSQSPSATTATGSFGIGKGGLDAKGALLWMLVGVPLAWGIWNTFVKTLTLF